MHLLLVDSEFWLCTSTEAENQPQLSADDAPYFCCSCGSFEPSFVKFENFFFIWIFGYLIQQSKLLHTVPVPYIPVRTVWICYVSLMVWRYFLWSSLVFFLSTLQPLFSYIRTLHTYMSHSSTWYRIIHCTVRTRVDDMVLTIYST